MRPFHSAAVLVFVTSLAHPQAVTINFDNLTVPTIVTNQYPEATFAAAPGSVVTVQNLYTQFGNSLPNYICTATTGGTLTCTADIYVQFTAPVNSIRFTQHGDNATGAIGQVRVFQIAGLVATVPIIGDSNAITPGLVDLSAYTAVTRIEIVNITDPGGLAYDDFQFVPCGTSSLSVPVTALVAPQGGGPPQSTTIGFIVVNAGGANNIDGTFTFAPGTGHLDNCYDFQWINVLVSAVSIATGTPSPTHVLVGTIPAIDPSPVDGPEPYYYNTTAWSSGLFGSNAIRVEGGGSAFFDARSSGIYSTLMFKTFLVINDVTTGTIPPTQFCVREGFSWLYTQATNSVSICNALQPDPTLVSTALLNGLYAGQAGFPGFPGWSATSACALTSCPLLAGSPPTISLAAGGTQAFAINAGRDHAGQTLLLAGSLSGATPGITIGSFLVPLNPDPYFTLTVLNPNTPPLANSFGALDGNGHAVATLTLPPGTSAALVGATAHHAYAVLTGTQLLLTSNSTSVLLVP